MFLERKYGGLFLAQLVFFWASTTLAESNSQKETQTLAQLSNEGTPVAQRPTRRRAPGPYVTNPEELTAPKDLEEFDRNRHPGWKREPGTARFGLAFTSHFAQLPGTVTMQGTQGGLGLGGIALLDFDFTQHFLWGFRLSAGYKRYLVTKHAELVHGSVGAFPLGVMVQKLVPIDPGEWFRYGIGVQFEIIDAPDEVFTDNALVLALDFDLHRFLAGLRGVFHTFRQDAHFLSVELMLGVNF